MALVPDDVVQLITASGTPDECRAKVREYVDDRLHLPDPLPARRRRAGDDRRICDSDGVMEVFLPRSLEEALALKAAHPDAVPVAGGTDLMVAVNFGRPGRRRCSTCRGSTS